MDFVLPEHDPVTHGAHLNLSLNFSPGYMEPAASFVRAGARMSGIQEHTGVLTKSLRREFGEAHTELKPKIPKSKNQKYVSGYDARRRDEKNKKVKPYVPVWDFHQNYSAAYFRKELKRDCDLNTQLSF